MLFERTIKVLNHVELDVKLMAFVVIPDSNNDPAEVNQLKTETAWKPPQMHNTNAKIVRAIPTTNLNESRTATISASDLNRGNYILLRGTKSSDNGHILLRTDNLTNSKSGLVLEDGEAKLGQIFIQQNDITKGVLVQSVKRLGAGTPILLLSGHDNSNGHILIQAAPADEIQTVGEIEESNDILVQALEGLNEGEASSSRSLSTPIGSGM